MAQIRVRIMNQENRVIKETAVEFISPFATEQMAQFMSANLPIIDSYIEVEWTDVVNRKNIVRYMNGIEKK